MRKQYNKPHNLNQVHDEILAQLPNIITDLIVEGSTNINEFFLTFPDSFESQIDNIVLSHVKGKSIVELNQERIESLKQKLRSRTLTQDERDELLENLL